MDAFSIDDFSFDPSIIDTSFNQGIDSPTDALTGGGGGGLTAAQGLSLIGTAGKIYGTLQMGQAKKAAGEYNAALVREQGVMDLYHIDKAEVATLSSARALYAKSGVTSSGSPLDAALQSAAGFELDKQVSNYNTQSRANMLEWEGKMAKKQADMSAGIQALEGAASLAMVLL
jgi:hypothetical protein